MLNSLFTSLSEHFCACQDAFYIIEVFTFRQTRSLRAQFYPFTCFNDYLVSYVGSHEGGVGQEALADEGLNERLRHGLVVAARIAYVGENLCQRLLMVDADEVAVLLELLLIIIIGVDVGA